MVRMSPNIRSDQIHDCIGLYCPEPVFRTRIKLDMMNIGEILEVIADDPASEEDIKSLIKRIGHELLTIKKEGNTLRFLIRKTK